VGGWWGDCVLGAGGTTSGTQGRLSLSLGHRQGIPRGLQATTGNAETFWVRGGKNSLGRSWDNGSSRCSSPLPHLASAFLLLPKETGTSVGSTVSWASPDIKQMLGSQLVLGRKLRLSPHLLAAPSRGMLAPCRGGWFSLQLMRSLISPRG